MADFGPAAQRVANALANVDDLDHLQILFVSNETADSAPELQRAIHRMLRDERARRETGAPQQNIALPVFSEWAPEAWMRAGVVVIGAAEAAAMTGVPAVTDFGFGLLQWWFVQIANQVVEAAYPCND